MRTRFSRAIGPIGWTLSFLVGTSMLPVLPALGEQPASSPSQTESRPSKSEPESVGQQIDRLADEVQQLSRSGLELMVASRGLQAERPRAKADEDAAERAERQQRLAQWISDIEKKRSELVENENKLNEVAQQASALRKLEMTDAEVEKLVKLELGIHNVVRSMQRGTRELDLARRRGVNALDQSDG